MTTIYASFEDAIYIILGLVWVIYSFYNAKKKQKAKNNPSSTNDKSFLESLINKMGGATENQEPSANSSNKTNYVDNVVEEEDYAEQEEAIFSYDDIYEKSNYSPPYEVVENEPAVITSTTSSKKNLTKPAPIPKKKNSKKRIDLRKAVIYSEILKKVYF
jgi:hypothetical protein